MNAPVSVIIPALNEEKYLPILLESIKNQSVKPQEIIIADAGSADKTKEIAKDYGCKIVKGGYMPTGRNNGAAAAKEEILLFLDSDTKLPPRFIERNVKEFQERQLGVATCYTSTRSMKFLNTLGMRFMNGYYRITQGFRPHAYGYCIFAKKTVHDAIKGFDEDIFVGEDQDYALRAGKIAKFGILNSESVIASMRRFEEDGQIKTTLKYLIIELHMIFLGKIKRNIFRFDVGKHV